MDQTFGARLRAQREQQQVALAAIAEETKISVALLEGLERDDVSRWPGGLFRRSYVRTYARRIGLDPEQVLREFLDRHPDPVAEASPVEAIAQATEGKRPRTRLGFLIAGLAGLRTQRQDPPSTRVAPPPIPHEETVARSAPVEAAIVEPPPGEQTPVENEPILEDTPAVQTAPRLGRLLMVLPVEPVEPRRDHRALEHNIVSMSRVCTRIACAHDDRDLTSALEEAVGIIDARGAILWVWNDDRAALRAVLAHGYPGDVLARLPEVGRTTDNAIAAAFRFGQSRVVRSNGGETGAFVAPLLTPDGCVGALALEFDNSGEQNDCAQAFATILSAQLSTLFAGTAQAALDEEWHQHGRSLAASY